ncbi:MAG: DNA mismatch repair endonuclease MutL [Bacteroidaceae bacterium]|nr:DNA mismatch repair endonuclease MutL [Bacteroidaceae bacterium]
MADIIHLLPDSVANQIAAGEVIQRPSSVIKELLENSVDAGAHRIDVVVVDAGRTSIQVLDNGKGMSETDARLAFERHATSKISQASDLFSLTTMGFRGEALPSIAAVSHVTLRTHAADADLGTCLTIEGGRVVSQEVDNCPVGCNFLVQNLFYNVPARRKFLKSNQTELSNIIQEFERVALVNPNLHFTFTHNDHLMTTLLPESHKQRIATLFGKKLGEQLLSVDVDTTLCTLHGYVGKPESARKKGVRQFFFINGRYMRHPYFHKAVQEAFEGLIQPTEQVPYILYMQVDPSSIDVNIHPTKTEIKFENEQAIWQILMAAVKEALGRFNAVPIIDFDVDGRPKNIPVYNPSSSKNNYTPIPRVTIDHTYNPFKNTESNRKDIPDNWQQLYPALNPTNEVDPPKPQEKVDLFDDQLNLSDIERSALHYQYRGQYIVTEVRSGLMVIDQHRAHTRILYNRYKAQLNGQPSSSQGLLFPELIQFSMSDAPLLEEIQDELRALGFEMSSLGGGSYSVQGMPAGFEGVDPRRLLEDIIETLKVSGQHMENELHHRMALAMARDAAIPVGGVLTQQEMENLVDELFQQDEPNYTPDGKVIVAIFPHETLEKLFK